MSGATNLLNKAKKLNTSLKLSPFTGVKILLDDENVIFAGDETGRVLEATFPWATQEMSNNILASVSGFSYQPFSAEKALLDPAAELGDGVSVGGVYSVLASVDTNFNALFASDIAAPSDEEIDHEYHYTSPEKRLERRVSKLTAELRVTSDSIQGIVEDVEQNRSEFEQTAEEINVRITNAENEISEITMSVDGISQSVENAEGMATDALQTANGFSQRITDAEGDIAVIEFTLDGVAYKSSLADGTTVINGGCITTGTIDASKADIKNLSVEKLTVAGKNIGGASSALNAIYSAYGAITSLTSHGLTLTFNSPDEGSPVLITGAGVDVGSGVVSWQKIIAGGQDATAVFG